MRAWWLTKTLFNCKQKGRIRNEFYLLFFYFFRLIAECLIPYAKYQTNPIMTQTTYSFNVNIGRRMIRKSDRAAATAGNTGYSGILKPSFLISFRFRKKRMPNEMNIKAVRVPMLIKFVSVERGMNPAKKASTRTAKMIAFFGRCC